MIYPKWLPYPKCWLKSLELFIYNAPVLGILTGFLTIYRYYGHLLFINHESQIIYLKITGIIFGFLLSSLLFAYIHFFFWGKPDPNPQHLKWLPSNESLIEGFFMTISSALSLFIALLFMLPFLNEIAAYDIGYQLGNKKEIHRLIWYFFAILITVNAYCYHFKYWLKRRADRKKANQEKSITK